MRRRETVHTGISLVLAAVMGLSAAYSVQQAAWAAGLGILLPVAYLGVAAGSVLALAPLRAAPAQLLGSLLGVVVTVWYAASTVSPAELVDQSRFSLVWSRLVEWIGVVAAGGTSYDELLFVLTMAGMVWFLAYNDAWFVLRYNWSWWAILPTGLVLLVNLGYAPRPDYRPFALYLLAALLLLVHGQYTSSVRRWSAAGLRHEGRLARQYLALGTAASLILLVSAWRAPTHSIQGGATDLLARAQQPWERLQDRWERAFGFLYPPSAPAPVSGLGSGFTSFTDSFELGGPLNLGNRTVFTATGQPRQYWRSVAFDAYTGRGWDTTSSENGIKLRTTSLEESGPAPALPPGLRRVEQRITVVTPIGRALFAGDQPVAVSRTADWDLSLVTRAASVPVQGGLTDPERAARGDDLARVRELLREIGPARVARASSEGVFLRAAAASPTPAVAARPAPSPDARAAAARAAAVQLRREFAALKASGIDARYTYRPGRDPVVTYSYQEPNRQDVVRVSAVGPVRAGSTYTATSVLAAPTDDQLNRVKAEAPAWVRQRYTALPDDLPTRVGGLAAQLTAGATTTHAKALAIQNFLRQMKYREDMPPTPAAEDFVDYFLFQQREGYCTYYASAMVVMLRSLGIPARIMTGFAPGQFDAKTARYVVTEAQAHAWPQVYYAGIGWVDYEPTPIRDTPDRRDVSAAASSAPQSGVAPPDKGDLPVPTSRGRFAPGGQTAFWVTWAKAVGLALGVLALLAAVVYALLWLRLRGLRGAARQYEKMLHLGRAIGVAPAPSYTPGEYGARLGSALPGAEGAVRRITAEYGAERFGRRTADESQLAAEWSRLLRAAAGRWPRRLGQILRQAAGRRGSARE